MKTLTSKEEYENEIKKIQEKARDFYIEFNIDRKKEAELKPKYEELKEEETKLLEEMKQFEKNEIAREKQEIANARTEIVEQMRLLTEENKRLRDEREFIIRERERFQGRRVLGKRSVMRGNTIKDGYTLRMNLPNELRWNTRDKVLLEQIDEDTLVVKRIEKQQTEETYVETEE